MAGPPTAPAPLAGVRVLDFTRVLAGPFCTALLADMGAEVIKIEPPHGDEYRAIGPVVGGETGYFLLVNRGKKSVVLDLKSARGRRIVRALAARSDVVVENFAPGVAARLGIDYASLSADNPGLVYVSVSGFGQEGPLAGRPAYDVIAQAMSGLMETTGDPSGPPTMLGESLGDLAAGLYASWGAMVALFARERTGRGQHVDVAMFDALFSLQITALVQFLYAGATPTRVGNRHPLSTPFGVFRAADGHVVIAVLNHGQFERLAAAVGDPGIARDPRFASDASRTRHEPELRAAIESWSTRHPVAEIVATLGACHVPAAPVWNIAQAALSDHAGARGLVETVQHPGAGAIPVVRQPVRFGATPPAAPAPAPRLDEHGEALLRELLGADWARVAGPEDDGDAAPAD